MEKTCIRCKKLEDEVKKLRDALGLIRRYSRHRITCDYMGVNHECSCGFIDAYELHKIALEETE